MNKMIQLDKYPVKNVLLFLLVDKTTGKNIVFATNEYSIDGANINEQDQITVELLSKLGADTIQPRVAKSMEQQAARTRRKAEVFTPSWICNTMNNHCDTEWFGKEGIFNIEDERTWEPTTKPIKFPKGKAWTEYIESTRLEITCGEAPFIVSRYDTTTAELIPIERRIGILDRKMRVVNENTETKKDWLEWTYRAFQSVYGYEFQGDNLLIARINLLTSFVEYMEYRWQQKPTAAQLMKITDIITWNLWQMDGLTGKIPYRTRDDTSARLDSSESMNSQINTEEGKIDCLIRDWRNETTLTYNSIKKENTKK